METKCRIYTSNYISKEELLQDLSIFLNGNVVSISCIETGTFGLDVDTNDEFDAIGQKSFPDGFLYFQYSIFVEFPPEIEVIDRVKVISQLLHWFWDKTMPAVAACDFEDLLPFKGGYKSNVVPWPK